MCEETDEYRFALIYPIKKSPHSISHSKVVVECDNDPHAKPVLSLISEESLIFSLKAFCGCPNQCLPPKTNNTVTFGDIVSPTRVTSTSTKARPKSTPGECAFLLRLFVEFGCSGPPYIGTMSWNIFLHLNLFMLVVASCHYQECSDAAQMLPLL